MPVTVTHHDKSKAGKDRVYFDGRNGWKDAYYLGDKCPLPAVGSVIEPESSSKTFDGARFPTWFLNGWKLVGNAGQQADPNKGMGAGNAAYSTPAKPATDGWDIQSGDLSRYASNIVASAITAGLIKEPSQVLPWAKYAYLSAEALRAGGFVDKPDPATHAGDPSFDDDWDKVASQFDSKAPF